ARADIRAGPQGVRGPREGRPGPRQGAGQV
ncbi:hypothetical protein BN1708_019209, partial [Verticillium longisporum]